MSAVFLLAYLSLGVVTSWVSALTVVDLTFELGQETIYWPGNPKFNFTVLVRGQQSAGYWYESNYFGTPEHGGTHVDAPAHFSEGKWRVHEIAASNLVGPAVVIDVSHKAASDPDYRLSVDDIQTWEATYGWIPDKSAVLMNSGRGSLYPTVSLVFGSNAPTDPSTFHFPGIHPDAATFLTQQRSVIAVGVDTPSVDYGQSTDFQTHIILGSHNVLGLENVRNLGQLPPRGATIIIGLVNLHNGSGGPARILAVLDMTDKASGSATILKTEVLAWGCVFAIVLAWL